MGKERGGGEGGRDNIIIIILYDFNLSSLLCACSYFSGHDHSLQFINDTDISYIVSGAGHETSHSKAHVVRHGWECCIDRRRGTKLG